MSLPVVLQNADGHMPTLPATLLVDYASSAVGMVQGFEGSFNRIKPGKADFVLTEGGVARHVANGQVLGVCLGMNPVDYCSWYEKNYEPGQEPEAPDLLWNWPDHTQFPAALPKQWHTKKNRLGQDRWDFRIARRSVWALVQPDANGQLTLNTSALYTFDITSASLYGQSDTQQNWYKWAGLIQLCNRYSQPPNLICSPAMFLTRILIDTRSTVSGVVYFNPMLTASGTLAYLDSATFQSVVELMQSQTVQDMLQVKEILTWPKTTPAPQPVAAADPAPVIGPAPMAAAPVVENIPTPATPVTQPVLEPVQTATAVAQPAPVGGSLLAAAQNILSGGAAAHSAQPEAAAAEPAAQAQTAAPTPTPGGVNPMTAEAIRNFGNIL